MNVIGNGVVVHVPGLFEEIAEMQEKGVQVRLCISH
jgi:adenylosuccinate synthase